MLRGKLPSQPPSWQTPQALAGAHEGSPLMSAQQFIVDRLNEPPFNMRLTLVAFDEKSPFELLEIVNAIMAQLSTDHQVDLRDETPDATANRMTDFLKVLNFKQTLDKQIFKQALLTLTRTRTRTPTPTPTPALTRTRTRTRT